MILSTDLLPVAEATKPEERDTFFATSPYFFKITYAINGHMHEQLRIFLTNSTRICANVRQFYHQSVFDLRDLNADVLVSSDVARSPDSIFAADVAVLFQNEKGEKVALMSRMRCKERHIEVTHARRALKRAGFKIIESECFREGSGDTLFDPNFGVWWAGVGQRTAEGAGQQLSTISKRPVIEVSTLDEDFYHLDTFLSFLPSGHVIVYKDAMAAADYKRLCAFYPESQRLELTREEAMKFAANLQFVSEHKDGQDIHHVLVPHDCPKRVFDRLKEWKYDTVTADIRGVRRAGGAIHCCFQKVWNLARYPLRPLPAALAGHTWFASSQRNFGQGHAHKPSKRVRENITKRPTKSGPRRSPSVQLHANGQRKAHRPLKSLRQAAIKSL